MKKKLKITLLMLMFLAFPFVTNAGTMKYDELPGGSYIIGKHVFTREGTGSLTIKEIMLAAKSIDGDTLDDMTILYKTMGGLYVDESTSDSQEVEITETEEFEYTYLDLVPDVSEKILATAEALNEKYYNNYSKKTIDTASDDFDSNLFYIKVGNYSSEEVPDKLSINDVEYDNSSKKLGIGLSGYIDAPVWKVENGEIYVATTWLIAESIPGQTTKISLGEETIEIQTLSNETVADSLTIKEAIAINVVKGYTNDVTLDGNVVTQKSNHGNHLVGLILEHNGAAITSSADIIYRIKDDKSMALTSPETLSGKTVTYATYLNYNNGKPYDYADVISNDYKFVIAGKGSIEFTINFEQMADLSDKIVEVSNNLNTKYYNKYSKKTIEVDSEEFDSSLFYVKVAKYGGEENPSIMTINGVEYDNSPLELGIGSSGYINAPVWKLEDKYLYVATTWLVAETLPEQTTVIEFGGEKYYVIIFDEDITNETLTVKSVEKLKTIDGHTNELVVDDTMTTITQTSSHGNQPLGITLEHNGIVITSASDIIYRLSADKTMAITKPDTLNGKTVTYGTFLKYNDGMAYTETGERNIVNRLCIPGKGVVTLNLNLVQVVK